MKRLALLLAMVVAPLVAQAQLPSIWTKNTTYEGRPVRWKECAIDAANNMYCIGTTQNVAANMDVVMGKYSSSGVLLWSDTAGGSLDDVPVSVRLDLTDNPIFLYEVLDAATESHLILAKRKPTGESVWSRTIDGTLEDSAISLNVDQYGRIFFAGTEHISGLSQGFIECRSSFGTLLWHNTLSTLGGNTSTSFGIMPSGISVLLRSVNGIGVITGQNTNGTFRFSKDTVDAGHVGVEPQLNFCHEFVQDDQVKLERFTDEGVNLPGMTFSQAGSSDYQVHGLAVDGIGNRYVLASSEDSTNGRNTWLICQRVDLSVVASQIGAVGGLPGTDVGSAISADPWGNVYAAIHQQDINPPGVGLYAFDGPAVAQFIALTRNPGGSDSEALATTMSKFGGVGLVGFSNSGADSGLAIEMKIKGFRSVAVTAQNYLGGKTATFTVSAYGTHTLPRTVTLSTNSAAYCPVQASVDIPAGSVSATFTSELKATSTLRGIRVTGTFGGVSRSAVFNLLPPSLASFSINPASVKGGVHSTGVVYITGPAPASGWQILISSGGPEVIVPPSTTVPDGATQKLFTINTLPVSSPVTRAINAIDGPIVKTRSLTVTP